MKVLKLLACLMVTAPTFAQIKPPADVNALISGKTPPVPASNPTPVASTPNPAPGKNPPPANPAPVVAVTAPTKQIPATPPTASTISATGTIPRAMDEVPPKVVFTVNPFTGTSKEYEDLQRRLAMSRIATQLADDISRRETILERSALIAPTAQLELVKLSRERTQAIRQGVEMIPPDRPIPDPLKATNRTTKSKEPIKDQTPVAIAPLPPPLRPRLVGLVIENNQEPVALVEFAGAMYSMKTGDIRPGLRMGKITQASAEINGLPMMVDLSTTVAIDRYSTQQSGTTVTRTVAPAATPPVLPGSPLSNPVRPSGEPAIRQQFAQPPSR